MCDAWIVKKKMLSFKRETNQNATSHLLECSHMKGEICCNVHVWSMWFIKYGIVTLETNDKLIVNIT